MVSVGKAAEFGILVRTGDAIQAARHVDTVVLDKTGTITLGEPRVVDILPAPGVSEAELLTVVGAAEEGSEHPIATAIVSEARSRDVQWTRASSVRPKAAS